MSSLVTEVAEKMIVRCDGNLHDIDHFLKVWSYARMIGHLEGLDDRTQEILELTAIVHDIACPLCRVKYGNTNGKKQEKEGPALAREFLTACGCDLEAVERVCWIVGHHHTYGCTDALDYQILLEADYIVNVEGHRYSKNNVRSFIRHCCKTVTGQRFLNEIYLE